MKCYVCVYRQPSPERLRWERTLKKSAGKPGLRKYVELYRSGFEPGGACFYDWGDDPGFFAAEEFLGDANRASWGVCRRDVRQKLRKGDFVIFFCAKEAEGRTWEYYYIGLGTVSEAIDDRRLIWSAEEYRPYRDFFNLLLGPKGEQREFIYEKHGDWRKRSDAPYILFDPSKDRTRFNLADPLLVATYRLGNPPRRGNVVEHWRLGERFVDEIYKEIPEREPSGKKLRTGLTNRSYPHGFQNLSRIGDGRLDQKRQRLLQISKKIACGRQFRSAP